MHIAIIGAGSVGRAVATGLQRAGHSITFGVRNPGKDDLAGFAADIQAEIMTPAAAAGVADIVILSVPWAAAENAVKSLGALRGKILIDCTNPIGRVDGAMQLVVGHTTSAAEMIQNWAPDARVVKSLNQVGAEIMADPSHLSAKPVMFAAGDDEAARKVVLALVRDLGFEALDAGLLMQARYLEAFAMVWINQAIFRGMGRNWAFGAIR